MADSLDKILKEHIDNIDKASTGKTLREALFNCFANLQKVSIPAKTLSGKLPSDFMMLTKIKSLFSEGLVFDSIPKKGSKKIVQSCGILDTLGNIKLVYDDYDKLFVIKQSDIIAGENSDTT